MKYGAIFLTDSACSINVTIYYCAIYVFCKNYFFNTLLVIQYIFIVNSL